jgi:predicted ArsR family transcriptional regulator
MTISTEKRAGRYLRVGFASEGHKRAALDASVRARTRRARLLKEDVELLHRRGHVPGFIAEQVGRSETTVRRYLAELEREGRIRLRHYGRGIIVAQDTPQGATFAETGI